MEMKGRELRAARELAEVERLIERPGDARNRTHDRQLIERSRLRFHAPGL